MHKQELQCCSRMIDLKKKRYFHTWTCEIEPLPLIFAEEVVLDCVGGAKVISHRRQLAHKKLDHVSYPPGGCRDVIRNKPGTAQVGAISKAQK